MNKPISRKVDYDNLPPEVKAKFLAKKNMNHPGSFQRPDMSKLQATQSGIGSKAPENAKLSPNIDAAKEAEEKLKKQEEESKQEVKKGEEDKIDYILDVASKILSEHKFRTLCELLKDPEDYCEKIGITFEDEDIDMLLFKGEVEKEIDLLKNGKMLVTYKSLLRKERDDVENMCSEAVKSADIEVFTKLGHENFKSKRLLAASLVSVNGQRLNGDIKGKVEWLDAQSDWIYQHLVNTFNLYVFAVNDALTVDRIKKA